MKPLLTKLASFITLAALLACTADGQFGAKSSPDDDRPSEDGEVVPGYLRGVKDIALEVEGDRATISAPPGTIVPGPNGGDLIIGQTDTACQDQGFIDIDPATTVTPNADGSFTATIDLSSRDPIVIAMQLRSGVAPVGTPDSPQAVISTIDQTGFKPVDDTCQESSLQIDDEGSVIKIPGGSPDESASEPAEEIPPPPADAASCEAAGFFWSLHQQKCEVDHPLVRLQFCYPNPDGDDLEDLVKDAEYPNAENDSDVIDDKVAEEDFRIVSCYLAKGDRIKVYMFRDADGRHYTVDLPYAPLANFIMAE